MTRFLFAFGLNRTCSGHIEQARKAVASGNNESAKEALKVIMERFKFGAIRLLKMKASQKAIYVSSIYILHESN